MRMGRPGESSCALKVGQEEEVKSSHVATTRELLKPLTLILVVFGIGATLIVYTMSTQILSLERDRDETHYEIQQLSARVAELEKERQGTREYDYDNDNDEDDDLAYDTLQIDNTEEYDMSDTNLTGEHRRIRRAKDDSDEGRKKKKRGRKNGKNSRGNNGREKSLKPETKNEKRRHECSAGLKEPKCLENILPAGLHMESYVPELNDLEKSKLNNKTDPMFELKKDGYSLSRNGMRPTAPLIKLWKVADDFRGKQAERMVGQAFDFDESTGLVKVKQSGLYYVYSQVLYAIQYFSAAPHSSHSIKVNDNLKFICMKSVDYVPEPANHTGTQRHGGSNPHQAAKPEDRSGFYAKHKTCYTGGLLVLAKGDVIGIYADLMLNSTFYSMESGRTFWGVVRMRSFNLGRK